MLYLYIHNNYYKELGRSSVASLLTSDIYNACLQYAV